MPRKKLIAANWKMYKTAEEARAFVRAFLPRVRSYTGREIVLCPPYTALAAVRAALGRSRVKLGAQDVHWEREGAFTGAISCAMLLASGCTHVILGHSERRQYFDETDAGVNRKLRAALGAGLSAIVCVGEQLAEREAGQTESVLRRQLHRALNAVTSEQARRITLAYEPVWAIGTGRTATPALAAAAHRTLRSELAAIWDAAAAERTRILYGGSVKPENARALMAELEIDGALVGGASLDPAGFAAIVRA